MDTLVQVEADLLELQTALESIQIDAMDIQSMVLSTGLESSDPSRSKSILKTIWTFIERVANAIGRLFGIVGTSSTAMRTFIAKQERSLTLLKGRQPSSREIVLSHEVNQLLVGNKVLLAPNEYTMALKRLDDLIRVVLKHHIPAVSNVSKELQSTFRSKPADNLTLLSSVIKVSEKIGLENLAKEARCKLVSNDKRFARTRPVYRGPDIIGNRSLFIDLPHVTSTRGATELELAKQLSETRVSYIYSYSNVDRVGGESRVRAGSYIDVRDLLAQLKVVLDSIDAYPIKSLERDLESLKSTYKLLESSMTRDSDRNEERYLKACANIVAAFSTWVSDPHAQLITNSLAVVRSSITMANRHLSNLKG